MSRFVLCKVSLDCLHACTNKQKRVKGFQQPQWYKEEINYLQKQRDKYNKEKDWSDYKKFRNKTCALIKKSKQNYFTDANNQNKDTKTIWKYIKDLNTK